MADYGLKIAKEGYGVDESDIDNYQFWSKYSNRSIKALTTLEITTNTGTDPAFAETYYQHDFGYIPQFMVYTTSYDGNFVNLDYQTGGAYGRTGEIWEEYLKAWATNSRLYVSALLEYYTPMSGTSDGIENTYTFNVIIFMEEVEVS